LKINIILRNQFQLLLNHPSI